MAKLLYVGRNDWNVKGISSKAYAIRRRARTVYFRYGSVQSIGGCGGRLYWGYTKPIERRRTFKTIKGAKLFLKEKISIRISRGYHLLPGRVRIYPPKKVIR